MPRSRPPERLNDVLRAGTRVFAEKGFRRTQMADVAKELGVSPGTLYNYVESKNALFHWCLEVAGGTPGAGEAPLPLTDPGFDATLDFVRRRIRGLMRKSPLDAALARTDVDDVEHELAGIIGHLYDRTFQTRRFQGLIERSAQDMPELFDAFYVDMRRKVIAKLTRYLEVRTEAGLLRPTPDVATTARLVLETQAWFARHRKGDPDSRDIDDDVARDTVVDVLVAGLLP